MTYPAQDTRSGGPVSPRERTLNERLHDNTQQIHELCGQIDEFLHRVAPRPPQPATVDSGRIERINTDGAPSMMSVLAHLEAAVARLHMITLELRKIA